MKLSLKRTGPYLRLLFRRVGGVLKYARNCCCGEVTAVRAIECCNGQPEIWIEQPVLNALACPRDIRGRVTVVYLGQCFVVNALLGDFIPKSVALANGFTVVGPSAGITCANPVGTLGCEAPECRPCPIECCQAVTFPAQCFNGSNPTPEPTEFQCCSYGNEYTLTGTSTFAAVTEVWEAFSCEGDTQRCRRFKIFESTEIITTTCTVTVRKCNPETGEQDPMVTSSTRTVRTRTGTVWSDFQLNCSFATITPINESDDTTGGPCFDYLAAAEQPFLYDNCSWNNTDTFTVNGDTDCIETNVGTENRTCTSYNYTNAYDRTCRFNTNFGCDTLTGEIRSRTQITQSRQYTIVAPESSLCESNACEGSGNGGGSSGLNVRPRADAMFENQRLDSFNFRL